MPMIVPNVRAIAVCDEAIPSDEEAEIFTLANARFYAVAGLFPHTRTIHLYLLLYCDTAGIYPGFVRVTRSDDRRTIHYSRFRADFDGSWRHIALRVELAGCRFPEAGFYWIEVSFMDDVLTEHARGDSQIYLFGEEDGE
jgi:hypothetical protein